MNRETFVREMRKEMSAVHVSPQLRSSTLRAAQGKEERLMKKKLSAVAVFLLILMVGCAAAIAMAYRAGILDFAGRYQNAYVPKDAQNYVNTDVLHLENDLVSVSVHELYYDGRISRMTVDVHPKNPATLLLGPTSFPEDSWRDVVHLNDQWDESDMRTIANVYQEEGYQAVYSADTWIKPTLGEVSGGMGDNTLNPDGTLTLYCQVEYTDDQPFRDAVFQLYLTPWETPLGSDSAFLHEKTVVLEAPLMLEADASRNETYVSAETADYPTAGVRVDQVRIELRPQEIHAVVDFTVIDRESYAKTDGGLWFEFINPESTAETPYDQRLKSGMSGGGSVTPLDGDPETATRFRQAETLGRNELHDTYTLRAYECWEKQRFETHTFEMVKAEE